MFWAGEAYRESQKVMPKTKTAVSMHKPGRELARSGSGRAGEKPELEWQAASQLEVASEPQNGARPELSTSSVKLGAARKPWGGGSLTGGASLPRRRRSTAGAAATMRGCATAVAGGGGA